jgi:hypothetical protein
MIQAGGKKAVTTAGTPVQLTTSGVRGKWITIQSNPGNSQKIYIGDKNIVKSTLAGVFAILSPTANPIQIFCESFSLNPEEIWLDADVNGESVIWGVAD